MESDSAMTSTQNSNGYYEVIFSKDFLSRNGEKIRSWNNNYAIYQDPDDIPSVTPYTTIPMEDGRGCYLTDNDNGAFSDLLKYNLTLHHWNTASPFLLKNRWTGRRMTAVLGKIRSERIR